MKNKRLIIILVTITVLLLIPFLAMQFTQEVHWSPFDFLVAGALLFGTGLFSELLLRRMKKKYRTISIIVLLLLFLLLWIELAVGVFGTPFGGH